MLEEYCPSCEEWADSFMKAMMVYAIPNDFKAQLIIVAGVFIFVVAWILSQIPVSTSSTRSEVQFVTMSTFDGYFAHQNKKLGDAELQNTLQAETWQNYWRQLYVEAFGEDCLKEHLQSQKIKPPKRHGWWGKLCLDEYVYSIRLLMGLGARLSKKRPTHPHGTGAAGFCYFLDNPNLPVQIPFLQQDGPCNVVIRHANALGIYNHDAGFEPRSLSIKFAEAEETAPMDLVLNTGEEMGFFNLPSFLQFVNVNRSGRDAAQAQFNKNYPWALKAAISGFRRAPASYTQLHYYSQIPFQVQVQDPNNSNRQVYCKFRVVPWTIQSHTQVGPVTNVGAERTGLPDLDDQRCAVLLNSGTFGHPRIQDRHLAHNYLTTELHDRLQHKGPVRYRLQMQFYEYDSSQNNGDDYEEIFNPNGAWDRKQHPFYDVAYLEIDRSLCPSRVETLKFNIGRLPPRLSLVEAHSPVDYNSIAYCRTRMYSTSQQQRAIGTDATKVAAAVVKASNVSTGEIIPYTVTTRTGADLFAGAGMTNRIKITFIGSAGHSSFVLLKNNWRRTRFVEGALSTFHVSAQDVGTLAAVRLEKQGNIHAGVYEAVLDEWEIESLRVVKNGEPEIKFTAGLWLGGLRPGTLFRIDWQRPAAAKQHDDHHFHVKELDLYMERQENAWPFNKDKDQSLPLRGDYDDFLTLPTDFQFRYKALLAMGTNTLASRSSYWLSLALCRTKPSLLYVDPDLVRQQRPAPNDPTPRHSNMDFFRDIFLNPLSPFRMPDRAERWRDDAEFANRFLAGANPLFLKGVDKLPSKLTDQLSEEEFQKICNCQERGMRCNKTLADLRKEKRLFHIDYSPHLVDISVYPSGNNNNPRDSRQRYVAPAKAWFYEHPSVKGRARLMPLAIQLQPDRKTWTEPHPTLFFPSDCKDSQENESFVWLAAKLHFQNADSQVHQFITHLFCTHLLMEPICVCKTRKLPPFHPVSRLLHHHTQGIVAINTLGRKILIGQGSISDDVLAVGAIGSMEMMKRFFHNGFDGNGINFVEDFNHVKFQRARKVDKLQFFPYRDDATEIWNAIERYVQGFIDLHFKNDKSVQEDLYLRQWLEDMKFAMKPIRLPNKFTTVAVLVEFLTVVIFRVTVGHAAVNFNQYDHYAHQPSAPLTMMSPPPTDKNRPFSGDMILDMMTPKDMMESILSNLFNLSSFSEDEKFLGQFFDDIFLDRETPVIKAFQKELYAIDQMIKRRVDIANREGIQVSGDSYHYLRPSRVPNGIFI